MRINPVSNLIYFQGGLKKNLRQGEAVLREFKREYPYLKSNTLWQRRLDNMEKRRNMSLSECREIIEDYGYQIGCARLDALNEQEDPRELGKRIISDGFGNCGETSKVISAKLDEQGIENKRIGFEIKGKNHVFNVIGMNKNGSVNQPATWGKNAVIVDGWMNFVLSVSDAIREYEKFYGARHYHDLCSDFKFDVVENL